MSNLSTSTWVNVLHRWLIRHGRVEEAKKSLLRLTSLNRETEFDADETIAMMEHTTNLEERITHGASYLDCFRGTDLRRTEIVCMCWAIQNLSGNAFSNYSTYFLEQAGLPDSTSYSFAMGQYAINMVGVFGAWGLMTLGLGRRTLYVKSCSCKCPHVGANHLQILLRVVRPLQHALHHGLPWTCAERTERRYQPASRVGHRKHNDHMGNVLSTHCWYSLLLARR